MRKSSFGFGGRLSSGPLRVKSTTGNTPQGKMHGLASLKARNKSTIGPGTSALGARNSSIGIRTSSIGTRGSGIGIRGRTDGMKDPRLISDKSFQQKSIKTLVDFLTENVYPFPISPKVLQAPPAREFFRIFEFIYMHLDPEYKLVGKMEEEVPRLLKMLGYPFIISKSYMFAVGSQHIWQHLLAALVWLVELVKYSQSLVGNTNHLDQHLIFTPDDEGFDSVPEDKILFEYTVQTYAAFMAGEDTYDGCDEELSKLLDDKYLGQSGGLEAFRAESLRIAEENELLEQEMSRVSKLQEQQEIMRLDEHKFRDYLSEVESVSRKHQQMLQDTDEQITLLAGQLQLLLAKNQHMQNIYEQQDLTPADVERLRVARLDSQRQEEGLERELEAVDSDSWKKEMNIARLHEQLESGIIEYSKLARDLKLIPVDAENANGLDFEFRSAFHKSDTFECIIRPALMAIKKQRMEALHQASSNKFYEENNLEQYKEHISEMKASVAQLEKEVKTKEGEIECRKQMYQRNMESLQAMVDTMERDIRTCETSSKMSLLDAEKDLRETTNWAEQEKAALVKKEQEYVSFMVEVCTLVSDQKTSVVQKLEDYEKDMKMLLDQCEQSMNRTEEQSRKMHQILASIKPNA